MNLKLREFDKVVFGYDAAWLEPGDGLRERIREFDLWWYGVFELNKPRLKKLVGKKWQISDADRDGCFELHSAKAMKVMQWLLKNTEITSNKNVYDWFISYGFKKRIEVDLKVYVPQGVLIMACYYLNYPLGFIFEKDVETKETDLSNRCFLGFDLKVKA